MKPISQHPQAFAGERRSVGATGACAKSINCPLTAGGVIVSYLKVFYNAWRNGGDACAGTVLNV